MRTCVSVQRRLTESLTGLRALQSLPSYVDRQLVAADSLPRRGVHVPSDRETQ